MIDILIDKLICEQFKSQVLPVLKARGLPHDEDISTLLPKLLKLEQRQWAFSLQAPQEGDIISIRDDGARMFNDFRLYVDNNNPVQDIRVNAVFGNTIFGEQSCPPKYETNYTEHPLLMVTSRYFTLMADILPDKNCFFAADVYPNEKIPIHLLSRLSKYMYPSFQELANPVFLSPASIAFVTSCDNCEGSKYVQCRKCRGTGVIKPKTQCKKCGGDGSFKVTCKKCGGTGVHTNKRGNHFECNSCSGRGMKSLTCTPCNGSGYWEEIQCDACTHTGQIECFLCKGSGHLYANFKRATESYVRRGKRIGESEHFEQLILSADSIDAWNESDNTPYSLFQDAQTHLQSILHETSGIPHYVVQKQLRQYANECLKMRTCLESARDAFYKTEGIVDSKPIQINPSKGISIKRNNRGVVYEFEIHKQSASWIKKGIEPFSHGTRLQFCQKINESFQMIELLPVTKYTTDYRISFLGCVQHNGRTALCIRFPVEITLDTFSGPLFVRPDVPPPSENSQIRHLERWCEAQNRSHSIFKAMALDHSTADIKYPNITLIDDSIKRNPNQHEAVRLALSEAPLVLIKGPPGTGKTTVITEIVRQLIDKNQKVLVCSQTHQAVRNVLERLHRAGEYRMLRHGDADNLSDIENRYKGGGSADSFYMKVVQHSMKVVDQKTFELESLEILREALLKAQTASQALNTIRCYLLAEEKIENSLWQTQLNDADNRKTISLSQSTQTEELQLKHPEAQEMQLQQLVRSLNHNIKKEEGARDHAKYSYTKKTGNPIYRVDTPQTIQSRLRSYIPNFLASPHVIQEKYSQACNKLEHLNEELNTANHNLSVYQQQINQLKCEKKDRDQQIRCTYTTLITQINNRHTTTLEDIAKRRTDAQGMYCTVQYSAAVTGKSEFPDTSSDDSPEQWNLRIMKIAEKTVQTKKLFDFLMRWRTSVESNQDKILEYYWSHIRVFFSTCVGLASWRAITSSGSDAVDLVIIDEAAHATLPETLIPMCYGKRVLLIGDEMQLPPSPPSDLPCRQTCTLYKGMQLYNLPQEDNPQIQFLLSSCWLERSAFEWLFKTRPHLPHIMLNVQFRMHPDIADFVASIFYPEGLQTGIITADRVLSFGEFNKPVCLISTSAYGANRYEEIIERDGNGRGYRNTLEANLVKQVIQQAQAELLSPNEFGIITPYSDQVSLLRSSLGDLMRDQNHVKLTAEDIASVDSFQGSERDVIIISFVRSSRSCPRCNGDGYKNEGDECPHCRGRGFFGSKLNFALDLRRLNVAFSRPRKMLILIGDIATLINPKYGESSGAEIMNRFNSYVKDKGKVLHIWEDMNHA
jgi:hypothetical protein